MMSQEILCVPNLLEKQRNYVLLMHNKEKTVRRALLIIIFILCTVPALAADLPVFEGLIEPWEIVEYSSQVDGILETVSVERGDWIEQGHVLATLKSGVENAMVKTAHARVDFANRKYVRNKQLYQKKLISSHDQDELKTEIQLARLQLSEAKERLGLRTIKSTIDGVVLKRTGAPGEYVGEEPFVTVAQLNPLAVELAVPDIYIGTIEKGTVVTVSWDLPKKANTLAKVVIVDEVIDAASGTFGVRLEMDNKELTYPVGIKCFVAFE